MSSAAALLALVGALVPGQTETIIFQAPGVLVRDDVVWQGAGRKPLNQRMLLLHGTSFGLQYPPPGDRGALGNPEADFSRLPTTYYHRKGPLGLALERIDWFRGPENTYAADARLPASLVGLGGSPLAQLASRWAEPPLLVLGLEAGTPAAYAHPGQPVHFLERSAVVIGLSQPEDNSEPIFTYVRDARRRGADVRIVHGEPRDALVQAGAGFYPLVVVNPYRSRLEKIHKELLTREGLAALVSRLRDDGVLCCHVSHRYFDLVPPLAAAAADLGYACRHVRDFGTPERPGYLGHFSSEWVMVARRAAALDRFRDRDDYPTQRWETPRADPRYLWRDGEDQSLRGLYRSDPLVGKLANLVRSATSPLYRFAWARPALRQVEAWLRSLDQAVVRLRNGG